MSEHQPKRTGLGCVLVLVCWGIAFLFVPAAAEDDAPTKADSVFNELYGERLEEAAKTSSCDDDVKLAEEMIGDANALDPKAQSELLGLMYTTAARLALRSNDQYGLATKALALWKRMSPTPRPMHWRFAPRFSIATSRPRRNTTMHWRRAPTGNNEKSARRSP